MIDAHPWALGTISLVAGAFLFAGLVKGVVGAGLPTFSVPILTLGLGLKEAIALIIVPALITNVWQAMVGGKMPYIFRRLGTFLLMVAIGSWFGVAILARSDAVFLSGVLGIFLFFYSVFSLATPQIPAPSAKVEKYLSPVMGGTTGVMLGMLGSFFVPGVLYLQALRMPRDTLVQAMGIAFTLCTISLWVGLTGNGLFSIELAGLSAFGVVPALIGMTAGQRLRRNLSEYRFRQALFGVLLIVAVYLAVRAFVL
ncbi:MAG: sulfite exporter TauE/SafE family protein [Rhodospirillales bacterium]|nr:sulfite exporter TauE/SafE family protein [Rhodospirillales bacterium]